MKLFVFCFSIIVILLTIFLNIVWFWGMGSVLFDLLKKTRKKTQQEQLLMNELNALSDPVSTDDLIRIYKKSKESNKKTNYEFLTQIILKLIKTKKFPKGVLEWLDNPKNYAYEDLCNVMEEFIALQEGRLKDKIAVEAYVDGFITAEQTLAYTDKRKYPKTTALLLSSPKEYDEIRRILQTEVKKVT